MKIKKVDFHPTGNIIQGQAVEFVAQFITDNADRPILEDDFLKLHANSYTFNWSVGESHADIHRDSTEPWKANWIPKNPGDYEIHLTVVKAAGGDETAPNFAPGAGRASPLPLTVQPRPLSAGEPVTVRLESAVSARTNDDVLFQSIRDSSASLNFASYQKFVDQVMCKGIGSLKNSETEKAFNSVNARRATVFPGLDAYQKLKVATEVYLMLSVRVLGDDKFPDYDPDTYKNKHGQSLTLSQLQSEWASYLKDDAGTRMLPVDDLIRIKLKEPIIHAHNGDVTACQGILQEKLRRPCFFELIWSYWHEEAMLVQTMKSISVRFQNKQVSQRDPLASFDIAPLYPLSNLLWGYIQDEQHRLTVSRRAYEYDHEYGIALDGKAVPALRSVDSRSKFIEAFHNLLHGSLLFFKRDDDTTIKADGFPVLNGLKEVHLLLREGMHNQFGDLPSTSRQEMLMEQWLLARPEMQQFLGGRAMMPYSEDWMDRVDTMKKLKGWSDVSVTYFHDLAKFGEQLLVSIRHGDWSNIPDASFAAHWAREWRPEIQQYVHAYRTVTGVDLSPEQTDVRLASDRYVQPSVHLRKRLDVQRQGTATPSGFGSPRIADAGPTGNGRRPAASRPNGSSAEMEFSEDFE
jgi:hypothetical protein